MSRIGIIAAMPGELKPLVKGWKAVPVKGRYIYKWTATIAGKDCVAVYAGMGADAAKRAFAEAEVAGPLEGVLSIGWAGALTDDARPGMFYLPNLIVDAQTGERMVLAEREPAVVLVTAAHVADETEKLRLAQSYKGTLVDMESATVVRLAQMRGIPVGCIKVITDEVTAKLPNLNPFINGMGQMEMGRFVGHVLMRPGYWPALMRLGRASSDGAETLAACVMNLLESGRSIDAINRRGEIPD